MIIKKNPTHSNISSYSSQIGKLSITKRLLDSQCGNKAKWSNLNLKLLILGRKDKVLPVRCEMLHFQHQSISTCPVEAWSVPYGRLRFVVDLVI